MIYAPNMLLIGSTGRDSGKTTFACSLIKRFHGQHEVVAAKVTTIQERDGTCPRGGEGCGVCAALDGCYCVTEETVRGGAKDTQRLLDAGADKVYWLRVRKEHLMEGAAALIDVVGEDRVAVCESNSLRTVVEPGLFFMFRHSDVKPVKASAKGVREHTDRIVTWDGAAFDLDPAEMGVAENRWTFRYDAAAAILAGGRSERMGRDKTLIALNGRPLVQHVHEQLQPHFKEVFISANDAGKFAFLGSTVVEDEMPDQGPLMGIVSVLRASPWALNLVVACDIPEVDVRILRSMMRNAGHCEVDAVVPRMGESHTEPLFAVYAKSALTGLSKALDAGVRRVRDALSWCNVYYLDSAAEAPMTNLNTIEDYGRYTSTAPKDERLR